MFYFAFSFTFLIVVVKLTIALLTWWEKSQESKALATHCQNHSLNLSVKTTTQQCKLLKDVISTVGEICILVKYFFFQSDIGFENDYDQRTYATLNKLGPTRWTIRATCYCTLILHYLWIIEIMSPWKSIIRRKVPYS